MGTRDKVKWEEMECPDCGHPYVVYRDSDGVWVECACAAGYVE